MSIRKDIDKDKFAFPQKEPLRLRLKDLLENEVEEKYFVDNDRTRELIRKLAEEGKLPERNKATEHIHPMKILDVMNSHDGCCKTIMSRYYKTSPRHLASDARIVSSGVIETENKNPHKIFCNYRIRKLTPKECWRLMGFDDADFEKARAAGISNTQLYKMAGNSICVPVLEAIFRKLYIE